MEQLPQFPPFECEADKDSIGPRWEKWADRLENLFVGLVIEDEARKRALMLHYAGERVYDVYMANKGETDATYEATKKVLTDYFAPKRNVQIEIFKFRSCKQKETETLDEYVTELRRLSKHCEFGANVDKEILSQLIQCCRSSRLRRRALRETNKNLNEILTMGRTLEMADNEAAIMERETERETVSKIHKRTFKRESYSQNKNSKENPRKTTCRNCGGDYPHNQGRCPAYRKTCNFCKKENHFKSVCRKFKESGRKVAQVTSEPQQHDLSEEDSDEYCYNIEFVGRVKHVPMTELKINKATCRVLIDTGSSVNILDETTYKAIGSPKLNKKHEPKLIPYGGNQPLKVIGECELAIETKDQFSCQKFFIVPGNHGSLLGFQTAKELNLVRIINSIDNPCDKFPEVFKGIGKLKDHTVKLHIDKSVKPVANCHRRTPFHLRDKVENELKKLLADDIIEKVEGVPTPWVSPVVTPPKKNPEEIRLCVDMREPNKAIHRERHLLPTTEELIHDLNGATVFSKLDLRSGYHQLELDEESRYITTFNTHAGIFRYKRLNFGISSASEVFQEAIRKVIIGVKGAKNISDDIIVFGKTQTDHDRALTETFQRIKESGLTLNRKKCELNKHSIEFFGMIFSKEGISPDPKKVEAIKSFKRPQDVKELKSFLGMASYCSRFIKDFATTCEPLRRLTRQDHPWTWSGEQDLAFSTLQGKLASDSVIAYYDPKKEMKVLVDASPVGLGAILQQEKVVAYASRSLSDTESRYSQTEREALAVVWACEHFDIYLRGAKHFTVLTDHKPLERIWAKPNPPLRIQRWGLRLQPYKCTIAYRPGTDNPADYMSRHPVNNVTSDQGDLAEMHVNFVLNEAVPKAMTQDEIKQETHKDPTLTKAIEFIRTGGWYKVKLVKSSEIDIEELKALASVKDELTVHSDNMILKEDKIILPKSLRKRAIDIAHEGHQGMTRTKSYLRSKVWFPKLNQMIEENIKSCYACQIVTPEPKQMQPLNMSDLPSGPWRNLSMDFCGPLPTGDYMFVIIDEYTRFPIVEIVRSVSANTVIPVLDKVLSEFGFPGIIKSDNGSPFNSGQFKAYIENCGIEHRRITPRWPRANAQAESFNKPMMKIIRAAHATGQSWKQQLYQFLRQYRATPHVATGFTPSHLLFNREPGTKLPHAKTVITNKAVDEQLRRNDENAKYKAKEYADNKNHASTEQFYIGDQVFVKHDFKKNKMSTVFKPQPLTVSAKCGNMLTAKSMEGEITRNTSRFKKVDQNTSIPDLTRQTNNNDSEDELPTSTTEEKLIPARSLPESQPISTPRPHRTRREPQHLKDYIRY